MRVTNDMAYSSLLRDLESISERMQNAQLQISSGKKLHKPSDNPTAASDVVRLQAEKGEIAQYLNNLASGKSRLGFADTTLQGVETMVERLRSLALLSLNSVSTAGLPATEVAGLRDQLLAAANTTFGGQFIFAGSNIDDPPYVQASDGTVTYAGNTDNVRLQIGRSATLQVQIPGSDIFSGAVDIFATMKDLANAMNTGDKSSIVAQVTKLEQFSGIVNGALGRVGSLTNVAQSVEGELTQYNISRTAERSRLEDADLSVAVTDYTQAETAMRAATAIGSRISNISILDYLS